MSSLNFGCFDSLIAKLCHENFIAVSQNKCRPAAFLLATQPRSPFDAKLRSCSVVIGIQTLITILLLQQLQKLKLENERLRSENRALTRVVTKLTSSANARI